MESVDVNGIHLHYARQGAGAPLVLLHGYPLDHSIWLDAAHLLEMGFDVFMPDLRGFGESSTVEAEYGIRDMADDIAGLLDALNIGKVCLVGHSMGGYVALAFAHAYPERVSGLGLVSTQAAADPQDRQEARYATARQVAEEGVGFIAASMPEKLSADPRVRAFCGGLIRGQPRAGIIGALKAMARRDDSTPLLASFEFPVSIVHGAEDALIPVERAREMKAALPRAHYLELPGAGHMPMMENPAATADALKLLV